MFQIVFLEVKFYNNVFIVNREMSSFQKIVFSPVKSGTGKMNLHQIRRVLRAISFFNVVKNDDVIESMISTVS